MTRYLRYAYAVFAWLFVGTIMFQVFLAGMFIFGQEEFRDAHAGFGFSIVGLAVLLLLIFAALARAGRRQVGMAALLFVLYIIQTSLPEAKASYPVVAALHPVNALLLFGLGVVVARQATALARETPAATESAPTESS